MGINAIREASEWFETGQLGQLKLIAEQKVSIAWLIRRAVDEFLLRDKREQSDSIKENA
jgi:hypothetical protein